MKYGLGLSIYSGLADKMQKKAMSAVFKLVLVVATILILVMSLITLIIKLGKSSVDVLNTSLI